LITSHTSFSSKALSSRVLSSSSMDKKDRPSLIASCLAG